MSEQQDALCEQAARNGLVLVYFPNGSSYRCFEELCSSCRHMLEGDEPLPPKILPPHSICAFGVVDRIVYEMAHDTYGYGNSFHPPEDMEIIDKLWPRCKRFTHRDDPDGEQRDPPPPDCDGQMFFNDVDVPVERVTFNRALEATR